MTDQITNEAVLEGELLLTFALFTISFFTMSGLLQRNMSIPIWVLMERMSSSIIQRSW